MSFFILAMNALAVAGFGVFLKPLTEEFGWERGALSGAFSLGALSTGILALIAGRLSDRYGPRIFVTIAGLLLGSGFLLMSQISSLWQVYLVWGLLIGIGPGCSVTPVISTIPRWFSKKRGIALAVTVSGFNFGATVGPILIQWLISNYSWQIAFIVLGMIPLVINIPLAQFLKRNPQQMGLKPYGEDAPAETDLTTDSDTWGLTLTQAVKTWHFWVFASLQFAFGFSMQIVVVHIVPHATDIGIPAIIAATILSISAGGRIVGNLTTGFLADRIRARLVLSFCFIVSTLSLAWLLFVTDISGFFAFAILFGITSGGIIPLLTLVPAELFGLRNLGVFSGAFLLFGTSGGALGSPFAGYIFDVIGSYRVAFTVSVVIGTLAVILSLILTRARVDVE
ncbi:MAG: MFS transporter [Dehalococcoidales bacterium]|nr:MFS transporter [Dehalococcoidales bacterium]MDP7525220.1 MFS transporter [Dehalococcoidales bacterium]